MNRPPVGFESHLPERRRRSGTTLAVGGCCSCCCLHTVGSLIGAAIASASGRFDPVPPFPFTESDSEHAPTSATGMKTVESAIQSGLPATIHLEEDEDNVSVRQPGRPRITAAKLFWQVLLGLSIAVLLVGVVMSGRDGYGVGLFLLAMVMPAAQLASAFVVAIVLLSSSRIDRDYQFRQLGKIVGGTVLGTVAGVLLMILIAFVLSATK